MKDKIIKVVYLFGDLAHINDRDEYDRVVDKLYSLSKSDMMDYIIIYLDFLSSTNRITNEDIVSNIDCILDLDRENYKSMDDIINRFMWLKRMNLVSFNINLDENHRTLLELFNRFNELVNGKLDCYYTGGAVAYIATNNELIRYHGDLDLFINEEQLMQLLDLIENDSDFELVSNLDSKEIQGHEFVIKYKDYKVKIGLFLFTRTQDGGAISKEYYKKDGVLYVDEHYFVKEYAEILFPKDIRIHEGKKYRMQSLEYIYNGKKEARNKDVYDASVIKDYVDLDLVSKINSLMIQGHDVRGKEVRDGVVLELDSILKRKRTR